MLKEGEFQIQLIFLVRLKIPISNLRKACLANEEPKAPEELRGFWVLRELKGLSGVGCLVPKVDLPVVVACSVWEAALPEAVVDLVRKVDLPAVGCSVSKVDLPAVVACSASKVDLPAVVDLLAVKGAEKAFSVASAEVLPVDSLKNPTPSSA